MTDKRTEPDPVSLALASHWIPNKIEAVGCALTIDAIVDKVHAAGIDAINRVGANAAEIVSELHDHVDELVLALKDCSSGLRYIRQEHGELYGVGFDRAIGAADKALKRYKEKVDAAKEDSPS